MSEDAGLHCYPLRHMFSAIIYLLSTRPYTTSQTKTIIIQ
jgi:hypothetical protein